MSNRWDDKPKWTEPLLQGLAFWLGYKSQLFRFYPLTEGAIVGEAASLIQANIDSPLRLECEVMYKNLKVKGAGNTRADFVIYNGNKIDSIIEVKRSKSSKTKIDEDFKRLAIYLQQRFTARCFVLLTSQNSRPKKITDKNGKAIRSTISGDSYVAKVRRVCKAASSFNGKEKAHYTCLIEVKLKSNPT